MLNSKQKKVAFELTGNIIVSASPGTGKTKTLVARAQKKLESMPKHKSLALITYTNAGADEIASRLHVEEKEIFIGTIHRFCLEFILRPFSWIYGWNKPRIVTFDELNEFIEINADIDLGDSPLDELGKVKRLLNGELDKSVEWENVESLEYIAELYFGFIASKKAIDFNEILYKSYKIISENRFVSDSLANKFYEISVDEFQDTNIFQYEILKAINQTATCTFFMVGDEKQKIYKFAGAIDNAFENASNDFNAKIENLDVTYRSTSNIINGYSSLFKNHPKLENESKYKNEDFKIIISEVANNDLIGYIENTIKQLIEKCNASLSEIAILTTSWRDAFLISRSIRQKYDVVGLGALPHRSINSSTFALIRCLSKFTFAPSIRNLRVIRRNVEFHALENNILLTEKELTFSVNSIITKIKDINLESTLLAGLNLLKVIFEEVFKIDNSDIQEIINSISNEEAEIWTLEKYFKTISGIDGITINTIHQAKGLEYDIVILNGVSENRIPYQRLLERNGNNWIYEPLTDENLENGRTLLYVGISRAKAILILIHNWRPSLFIKTIKAVNN
jgi:DNA helicase-2/ATP-dependent DNA helicase PcrA